MKKETINEILNWMCLVPPILGYLFLNLFVSGTLDMTDLALVIGLIGGFGARSILGGRKS